MISKASTRRTPTAGTGAFDYTERHVKCAWFAPELRPVELRTSRGESVIVEKPGRWNLEKGPDFLDAALLVGRERRKLSGDIEVHVHPADWQRHGHAGDPAYARVIAHVTYFPGRLPPATLPPGAAQIALKEGLVRNPYFSFEAIDITAYPFAVRKGSTPCSKFAANLPPESIDALLAAAGQNRIERKAARLAGATVQKGEDQVLYEEIMAALGFKQNRMPFRQLAERLPVEALREDSGLNPVAAYALLAGVAGLLPSVTSPRWDDETRRFIRKLWNCWWKLQAKWSGRIMSSAEWTLSNLRPQNHPRRRLMAAAVLFSARKTFAGQIAALKTDQAGRWVAQALDMLQSPTDDYWRRRLAIGGKTSSAPIALIGKQRAAAIVSNAVIPLQIGLRPQTMPALRLLRCLPPEEDNIVIRQCAFNLFGPDHNAALYRAGLLQQGLIHIFHDFCLTDRSNCSECGFLQVIGK
jgi:hypothetical protein